MAGKNSLSGSRYIVMWELNNTLASRLKWKKRKYLLVLHKHLTAKAFFITNANFFVCIYYLYQWISFQIKKVLQNIVESEKPNSWMQVLNLKNVTEKQIVIASGKQMIILFQYRTTKFILILERIEQGRKLDKR